MLFLVTMTHSAESCPSNNPEKMPEAMESVDAMESLAKELNIKIHFQVIATLEHTTYALVEADSVEALSGFFGDVPFPQMSKVTPVEYFEDVMKRVKEKMQQEK